MSVSFPSLKLRVQIPFPAPNFKTAESGTVWKSFPGKGKTETDCPGSAQKIHRQPILSGYFWGYITPCQESIPPCPSQIPQYAAQSPPLTNRTSRKSSLTATASFSMSRQAAPKAGAWSTVFKAAKNYLEKDHPYNLAGITNSQLVYSMGQGYWHRCWTTIWLTL